MECVTRWHLNLLAAIWIIIFTGSIARSANCWYLIYSEANFEVFRPAGATRAPNWCNDKGVGHQKLKFLLKFDRNVEYRGAYLLRDFHKICTVCTPSQNALGVKMWLDLLEGLWSYEGFKLRGSGFPQIFSAP